MNIKEDKSRASAYSLKPVTRYVLVLNPGACSHYLDGSHLFSSCVHELVKGALL